MNKHTSGPYVFDEHESGPQLILSNSGIELARTSGIVNDVDEDSEADGYAEDRANARLFAAAPEMLEMLKKFSPHCVRPDILGDLLDEAKKIIAKAEGSES